MKIVDSLNKIFNFPIDLFFTDKDMREKMMLAKEGTMFLIGENIYKSKEGNDECELTWAKIIKTKS